MGARHRQIRGLVRTLSSNITLTETGLTPLVISASLFAMEAFFDETRPACAGVISVEPLARRPDAVGPPIESFYYWSLLAQFDAISVGLTAPSRISCEGPVERLARLPPSRDC